MSELTHDTAEDGFHEIQLSGKQLVFLFMAGTVVSVVIFLLGVLVGRNVRSPQTEPIGTETVASAPAATPESAPPAAAEPPTPPDELSYPKRLEGDTPKDTLKPQASAVPEEKPVAPPPVAEAAAPPPKPTAAASPTKEPASVPTSGRPGRWVVQVTALRNRDAAAEIVQRLIGKGYPAFLLSPSGGTPLYRIQVGRYNDRNEAEQIRRRLAREEQFTPDIKR